MDSDLIAFALTGYLLTLSLNLSWAVAAGMIGLAKRVGDEPPRAARTIYHELRPFYLPLAVGNLLAANYASSHNPSGYIVFGLMLINWFQNRDIDDDDRWTRRRRRLAERVTATGEGRLIVVPAGA